jgi:hypothetical protein
MRSGSLLGFADYCPARQRNGARFIRDSRIDPRAAVAWVSSDHQARGEARGNARGYSRGVRFGGPVRNGRGSRSEATKTGKSASSGGGLRRTGNQRIHPGTSERVRVSFRLARQAGQCSATLEIPAERTEMDGATLQSLLLQLELAGRIGALPGGRFTRLERRFFYVMLHSRQNLLLATPDKSLYEEDCKEPCPR